MKISKARKYLEDEQFDIEKWWILMGMAIFHDIGMKRSRQKFHHNVQKNFMWQFSCTFECTLVRHTIRVIEHLQNIDFAILVFGIIRHFLNCNNRTVWCPCTIDDTKGTFSEEANGWILDILPGTVTGRATRIHGGLLMESGETAWVADSGACQTHVRKVLTDGLHVYGLFQITLHLNNLGGVMGL
jgi:hypothetical protein